MDEQFVKGRNAVMSIIIVTLTIAATTIIFSWLVSGFEDIVIELIRFALTCGLCYGLYRGYNWARYIMIPLAGLTSIISFLALLTLASLTEGAMIFLMLGLLYGAIAFSLMFSKNIKYYFENMG